MNSEKNIRNLFGEFDGFDLLVRPEAPVPNCIFEVH